LSGKKVCKEALQRKMGLDVNPDVPVIGIVTRLADQKGIAEVFAPTYGCLYRLCTTMNVQVVVLGSGEKWCESEIYTAKWLTAVGVVGLIVAIAFWKWGTIETARAIVLPLVAMSVLQIGIAVGTTYTNRQRIDDFREAYQDSPERFLQSEKERVAAFMPNYTVALVLGGVMLVAGFLGFALFKAPIWRAIALMCIYFTLTLFTLDYFTREHADIYQQQLESLSDIDLSMPWVKR
jgi:fatty acid desaturase